MPFSGNFVSAFAISCFALGSTSPLIADDHYITGLDELPGGDFFSEARAVSDDGRTIVGLSSSDALPDSEACQWTWNGTQWTIDGLGDFAPERGSVANDVSADGSIIVGSGSSENGPENKAFRWTAPNGLQPLTGFPNGDAQSVALAVTPDGNFIAGTYRYSDYTAVEAFRWQDGEVVGLGFHPPFGNESYANAISADGSVVVGAAVEYTSGLHKAYRWEDGRMTILQHLVWLSSGASDVSADGQVVVGGVGGEAFRWDDLEIEHLGILPGQTSSRATAVSADGSTVFGISGDRPFIWTREAGMRDLLNEWRAKYGFELTGWTDLVVTDLTPDARTIVGYGQNPEGERQAWVAYIGGPSLDITGECPGRMEFHITDATPVGRVAVLYARGEGSVNIPPPYPCAGTALGLNSTAKLARIVQADANGEAQFAARVPARACGRIFVQAIDLASCATSNVQPVE